MATGKKWDYTMTGDEFECVMAYAKSVASSVWSIMYDNNLEDKLYDPDFEKLDNTEDDIFEDKTKTKKEWEEIIKNRRDIVLNKFDLKW